MRHILGHTSEFRDFSEELTDLAEVVVNTAYYLCHEDLRWQYGNPRLEDGPVAQMSVVALGKCGGRELGFASDIELMFIYEGNGRPTAATGSARPSFMKSWSRTSCAPSMPGAKASLRSICSCAPTARQAAWRFRWKPSSAILCWTGRPGLTSARRWSSCAPSRATPSWASRIEALRDKIVYRGAPFDVTAMRAMRERQLRHLVKGGTFNPKYSPGGLVDIEYLVQGLQITHGHLNPELRTTNTYTALAALAAAGILSEQDYPRLRKAYTFFRWLIDGLRVVAGNARDLLVPAPDSVGFAYLARRMLYTEPDRLKSDLELYSSAVLELNRKLLR